MSDSSALRFAVCTLSRTGAAPLAELQLDPSLVNLANQPIEAHSFAREFELIAKYSDILGSLEKQARNQPEVSPQNKSEKLLSMEEPLIDVTGTAGGAGSAGAASPANVEIYQSFVQEKPVDSREAAIREMMQQTGEERDACFFYLESMSWNLQGALELFQSMAIK